MKKFSFLLCLCFLITPVGHAFAESKYVDSVATVNQEGALELAKKAQAEAKKLGKEVTVAILDRSGTTILLLKADHVGPHNTEASRRKAFTSLSTKTPSYDLMKKAAATKDARNLNTLPELLLLGGGVPIFDGAQLVGSIGVSGGGGGLNDHKIAKAAVEALGFKVELRKK